MTSRRKYASAADNAKVAEKLAQFGLKGDDVNAWLADAAELNAREWDDEEIRAHTETAEFKARHAEVLGWIKRGVPVPFAMAAVYVRMPLHAFATYVKA